MKPVAHATRCIKFAVVVAFALVISACTLHNTKVADRAAAVQVSEAYSKLFQARTMQVSVSGLHTNGVGVVDVRNGAADITFTGELFEHINEVRRVNGVAYMHDNHGWHRVESSDHTLLPARMPLVDPAAVFLLLNAQTNAGAYGGLQVSGIPASRVDVDVHLDRLSAAACSSQGSVACDETLYRSILSDTASTFPMQVYVDKNNRLIRMQYQADVHSTKARATDEGGPLDAVAVDVSDFGVAVNVTAPAVAPTL